MPPVLGYWKQRGLAQPIRLLLNYVEEEYEEKYYESGPAPDFSRESWLSEKFKLGLPFPNNPYWIDGDIAIVQSHAILKHLGRKHNLCPTTEQEKIRCDILEHQLDDFVWAFIYVCYAKKLSNWDYAEKRSEYLSKLPDMLKEYSEFLEDRPWFTGKNLTYVDFLAYDILDMHRVFAPGCLDDFKNLVDFMANFEALPTIKKYMQSDRFLKKPIWNKYADWRGD
ncbi:glutathione S-transferase Mu 2-like [Lingula anatina]|uniref:glutathione transferase n=1 Tax=Lingula anatina TaxID=7574 RepID=A0A1S3IEV8_LINAN|nr:glutathione S-transferase Mu 2-like [Lingula anatina]|eukprot:XP_013396391.1 glutathione S-transferase Mu 2-like [Lingula anatina]